MVYGESGYAVGINFTTASTYPEPVVSFGGSPNVGTTLNPRVDVNSLTYTGIRVFAETKYMDVTANNFYFRSEAGAGSIYDRGLQLKTYDVNASSDVVLEPYSLRPLHYKNYLGRESNPFANLYVTNLWNARIRNATDGVRIESKDGNFGLQIGNSGIFLIKDGKYTSLHI